MPAIPSATVGRLVTYLRVLTEMEQAGVRSTSSDELGAVAHVSAFQVRKDLAYFGRFGTRGSGYTVATLRRELRRILGLTRPWNVAIMGMGRLGQALADYPNFDRQEFQLEAAFDVDPRVIGRRIGALAVEPVASLAEVVAARGIDLAFLTVPASAAQGAANQLVAAGLFESAGGVIDGESLGDGGEIELQRAGLEDESHPAIEADVTPVIGGRRRFGRGLAAAARGAEAPAVDGLAEGRVKRAFGEAGDIEGGFKDVKELGRGLDPMTGRGSIVGAEDGVRTPVAHLRDDLIEGVVDRGAKVRGGDGGGDVNGGGPGSAHGLAANFMACLERTWFNQVVWRHVEGEGDHSGMTSRVAT
jgi:redox-sensing transcriptional repressor